MRAAGLVLCGIGVAQTSGQESWRPRISDVQESIDAAKANAQRVRTDANRKEFMGILNDVEAALNAARKGAGKSKQDEVMEKIHQVQPNARNAMISAARKQSVHVKKVRSVTISDSEIEAKEKGIVRKVAPRTVQKPSLKDRINPMRWFGRNRQYTRVLERSPAPRTQSRAVEEPKDVMVRVPTLPYVPLSASTHSSGSAPVPQLPSSDETNPSTVPVPVPVSSTPDQPLVELGKKNTGKYKPHRFIPVARQGSSRRISELNRDGRYRLPRGSASSTASSPLTRKIKKPERKSTRSWNFGPNQDETSFVTPSRPEPRWVAPSEQKEAPKEAPTQAAPPEVVQPKEKGEGKFKPSWVPRIFQPKEKSDGPPTRIPPRPGLGRSRFSVDGKSAVVETKQEKPPVSPAVTKVEAWVTPKPAGPTPEPAAEEIPKPSTGSATSPGFVVKTVPAKPRKPADRKPPAQSTGVSGIVVANTRPEPTAKVPVPAPPAEEEVAVPPVVQQASILAAEMKEEEARVEEQLEGLDKMLSDNANVLKEAEALLKELEELDRKSAAKPEKKKSASPGKFHRPGVRRPSPRKTHSPKPEPEPSPEEPAPVQPKVESKPPEAAPEETPQPKSKWGPRIRRPGVRR